MPTWKELRETFRELQPPKTDGLYADWFEGLDRWELRYPPTESVLRRFKSSAAQAAVKAGKKNSWQAFLDVLKDEEHTFHLTATGTFRLESGEEVSHRIGRIPRVCEAAADYCEKRMPDDEQQTVNLRPPAIERSISTDATGPINRKTLRDAYFATFQDEKIKILDICWAVGQHYREWKRWLAGGLKDGSTADLAFRRILSSNRRPIEFNSKPRRPGWQ